MTASVFSQSGKNTLLGQIQNTIPGLALWPSILSLPLRYQHLLWASVDVPFASHLIRLHADVPGKAPGLVPIAWTPITNMSDSVEVHGPWLQSDLVFLGE